MREEIKKKRPKGVPRWKWRELLKKGEMFEKRLICEKENKKKNIKRKEAQKIYKKNEKFWKKKGISFEKWWSWQQGKTPPPKIWGGIFDPLGILSEYEGWDIDEGEAEQYLSFDFDDWKNGKQ